MKLYPPLKQTSIGTPRDVGSLLSMVSQPFGVNPQDYAQFGIKGHNGLDWPCVTGTTIYASQDGIVSNQTDNMSGIGCVVTGPECKTIYWHLKSYAQPDGASVKIGDIIGISDNTGYSTGPHLHFGLKLLDVNGNVLNRDNGFDGAVDPTSYLVWYDQEDVMTLKEVLGLQALEGYNDPIGAQYWVGKTLQQYLDARLADKIKTIQLAQ